MVRAAYVTARDVPLGPPYVQAKIWVGFQITFQYPYDDVYPRQVLDRHTTNY